MSSTSYDFSITKNFKFDIYISKCQNNKICLKFFIFKITQLSVESFYL